MGAIRIILALLLIHPQLLGRALGYVLQFLVRRLISTSSKFQTVVLSGRAYAIHFPRPPRISIQSLLPSPLFFLLEEARWDAKVWLLTFEEGGESGGGDAVVLEVDLCFRLIDVKITALSVLRWTWEKLSRIVWPLLGQLAVSVLQLKQMDTCDLFVGPKREEWTENLVAGHVDGVHFSLGLKQLDLQQVLSTDEVVPGPARSNKRECLDGAELLLMEDRCRKAQEKHKNRPPKAKSKKKKESKKKKKKGGIPPAALKVVRKVLRRITVTNVRFESSVVLLSDPNGGGGGGDTGCLNSSAGESVAMTMDVTLGKFRVQSEKDPRNCTGVDHDGDGVNLQRQRAVFGSTEASTTGAEGFGGGSAYMEAIESTPSAASDMLLETDLALGGDGYRGSRCRGSSPPRTVSVALHNFCVNVGCETRARPDDVVVAGRHDMEVRLPAYTVSACISGCRHSGACRIRGCGRPLISLVDIAMMSSSSSSSGVGFGTHPMGDDVDDGHDRITDRGGIHVDLPLELLELMGMSFVPAALAFKSRMLSRPGVHKGQGTENPKGVGVGGGAVPKVDDGPGDGGAIDDSADTSGQVLQWTRQDIFPDRVSAKMGLCVRILTPKVPLGGNGDTPGESISCGDLEFTTTVSLDLTHEVDSATEGHTPMGSPLHPSSPVPLTNGSSSLGTNGMVSSSPPAGDAGARNYHQRPSYPFREETITQSVQVSFATAVRGLSGRDGVDHQRDYFRIRNGGMSLKRTLHRILTYDHDVSRDAGGAGDSGAAPPTYDVRRQDVGIGVESVRGCGTMSLVHLASSLKRSLPSSPAKKTKRDLDSPASKPKRKKKTKLKPELQFVQVEVGLIDVHAFDLSDRLTSPPVGEGDLAEGYSPKSPIMVRAVSRGLSASVESVGYCDCSNSTGQGEGTATPQDKIVVTSQAIVFGVIATPVPLAIIPREGQDERDCPDPSPVTITGVFFGTTLSAAVYPPSIYQTQMGPSSPGCVTSAVRIGSFCASQWTGPLDVDFLMSLAAVGFSDEVMSETAISCTHVMETTSIEMWMTVVPPVKDPLQPGSAKIDVAYNSAVDVKVCTLFMWTGLSAAFTAKRTAEFCKGKLGLAKKSSSSSSMSLVGPAISPTSPLKKMTVRMSQEAREEVRVLVFVGIDSKIDVTMGGLNLTVEDSAERRKPDVSLAGKQCVVQINDFDPIMTIIEDFSLSDTFRLASEKEISSYMSQRRPLPDGTFCPADTLSADRCGRPLVECISVKMGNVVSRIAPELFFGRVIEDMAQTPKSIFDGMSQAGFRSKIRPQKPKLLMDISANFGRIDFSILEDRGPDSDASPLLNTFTEFAANEQDDAFVHRFRFFVRGAQLKVGRKLPFSTTQSRLNELDEDPAVRVYGIPMQGGHIRADIDHAVVVVDPLTLAVPLVVLKKLKWRGELYIVPLSPLTPRLAPPRTIHIPWSTFDALSSDWPRKKETSWVRGMTALARGLNPKIYMDGTVNLGEALCSFGVEIQAIVPKLMAAIDRARPPPAPLPPGTERPPPLPPWDSMRFFLHGKLRASVGKFAFRWLLDSVKLPEWSILLQTSGFEVSQSVGRVSARFTTLVLSLPRQSHPLVSTYANIDFEDDLSLNRRHSIVLIPRLSFDVDFDWVVARPRESSALNHHSTNLVFDTPPPPGSADDKFYRFRSHGVNLGLKATVCGDSTFTNWIAIRLDILPWLTHKQERKLSSTATSRATTTPRSPPAKLDIQKLDVAVSMSELRAAIWYGPDETDGVCVIIPRVDFARQQGLGTTGCTYTEVYIAGTQAVLLDIQSNRELGGVKVEEGELKKPEKRDDNRFDLDTVEHYDRLIGNLGANVDEQNALLLQRAILKEVARKNAAEDNNDGREIFTLLQVWSKAIGEKRYLVETGSFFVVDRPLAELKGGLKNDREGATNDKKGESQSIFRSDVNGTAAAFDTSQKERAELGHGSHSDDKRPTSWTVLVSGMKLLWTLDIRDAIVLLMADVLATKELMTLQAKLNNEAEGKSAVLDGGEEPDAVGTNESVPCEIEGTDQPESSLMALLQVSSSVTDGDDRAENNIIGEGGMDFADTGDNPFVSESAKNEGSTWNESGIAFHKKDSTISDDNESFPIVEVHLCNPQIQLHSEATGGSIVLAIRGAYIEGFQFTKMYADSPVSDDGRSPGRPRIFRKQEFRYTLDQVEAFSVDTDIDVGAGLQWLSTIASDAIGKQDGAQRLTGLAAIVDLHTPRDYELPVLLRKILTRFSFRSRQFIYRTPLDVSQSEIEELLQLEDGVLRVGGLRGSDSIVDTVEVHLDHLCFFLDSYQFSTTTDVVRHVILAPPPPPRAKPVVAGTESAEIAGSTVVVSTEDVASTQPISTVASDVGDDDDSSLATSNYSMDVSNTESGDLKSHTYDTSASIPEQGVEKRGSAKEKLEKTLVRFNASRKRKPMRNLLRAAVREMLHELEEQHLCASVNRRVEWTLCRVSWRICIPDALDDAEIELSGLRGQHDFFSDGGMSTRLELEDLRVNSLKPAPDSMCFKDPSIVLATALGAETSPCLRCGAKFDRGSNSLDACVFHGDGMGIPVSFSPGEGRWPCCGDTWVGATGCISRPHTGKERAVYVRVQAFPRPVRGITVYRNLEVNIYPEVPHTIIVQMTKSVANVFQGYFMGEKYSAGGYDFDKDDESRLTSVDDSDSLMPSKGRNKFVRDLARKRQTFMGGKSQERSDDSSVQSGSVQSSPDRAKSRRARNWTGERDGQNQAPVEAEGEKKETEIIFVKHWQVGHINTDVSLSGFPVEPMGLGIQVPAFVRSHKIGIGGYLGRKFVSHLIHEVVKSAARSGMNKVGTRITGNQLQVDMEERKRLNSTDYLISGPLLKQVVKDVHTRRLSYDFRQSQPEQHTADEGRQRLHTYDYATGADAPPILLGSSSPTSFVPSAPATSPMALESETSSDAGSSRTKKSMILGMPARSPNPRKKLQKLVAKAKATTKK